MALPIMQVAYALQIVLLNMLFNNFEEIVERIKRDMEKSNLSIHTVIYFRGVDGGVLITMERSVKGHYVMKFANINYDGSMRDFEIKLGTGKQLANRRVMNELGVKLNFFLDPHRLAPAETTLRIGILNFCSSDVTCVKPSWWKRTFGCVMTNFKGEMKPRELPGLFIDHHTTYGKGEPITSLTGEVHLFDVVHKLEGL